MRIIRLSLLAAVLMTATNVLSQTPHVSSCDPNDNEIGLKTVSYFDDVFNKLSEAAKKEPDHDSYRKIMKPVADETDGFYGGTLLSSDWVITQVYYPTHFLANGYDLKNVKELSEFIKLMNETPAPQLSEPGHGSLFQPRLLSMRYPVIKEGKLESIISIMIRTEEYLRATGLDKCKAYRITCLGKIAEEKGKLPKDAEQVKIKLPSTEWVVEYQK